MSPKRLRGLAGGLCGALGAGFLALAAPAPASAQGLDGSNNLLDSAMQLFGLKDDEPKPDIDYRERAPLVVPPKVPDNLPEPQKSASDANPNWPKDADLVRRQREAEEAKKPILRDDPGRPLLPSELRGGKRKLVGNSNSAPTEPVGTGDHRDVLPPDQLGPGNSIWGAFGGPKQDKLTFNGEPERENLLQPPAGYQTPAPNAPYGVVEEKKQPFKFPTLFDRTN